MKKDNYQVLDRSKEYFSDFLVDLNQHPNTGDIVRFVDENSVKRSIKNLIMTDYHERLYQPDIGSGIKQMLFELTGTITESEIKSRISALIEEYEKRCFLENIDLVEIENGYRVSITFSIINTNKTSVLDISLFRVR